MNLRTVLRIFLSLLQKMTVNVDVSAYIFVRMWDNQRSGMNAMEQMLWEFPRALNSFTLLLF